MNELPFVEFPEITSDDIAKVTKLMCLPENAFFGSDGADPRQDVLKSMESMDVEACPGSGKTTLLVAKLAILAEKWKYRTRGMCVLSHTNAARNEIESRLGASPVGRQLFAYPHFIGTIHSFVNEFLALPWLRSKGLPIKIIDTKFSRNWRWNSLSQVTRNSLKKKEQPSSYLTIKSPNFALGNIPWGSSKKKGKLGADTDTYRTMQDVCRKSIDQGYYCFEEMFVWANDLIDTFPESIKIIRDRFSILFIDEAQDNSEEQSCILYRIFTDGPEQVIRQRFGDANQAIFDFSKAKEATTDVFPNSCASRNLPNSFRFGQKIADLAAPLGLTPCNLVGQGPCEEIKGAEDRNTIFVFDGESVEKVLGAYGELILKVFPEDIIRTGTFTAVGMVHKDPGSDCNEKQMPKSVCHYWPSYNPKLCDISPQLKTFVQYVFAGLAKAQISCSTHYGIEKTAEGILHLAGMVQKSKKSFNARYRHRYLLRLLEEKPDVRKEYEDFIFKFLVEREPLMKELWEGEWKNKIRSVAEAIDNDFESNTDVESFLEWKSGDTCNTSSRQSSPTNVFRYSQGERYVNIHVGSIHSVKGETHTSTLIFETYWKDQIFHNLEKLSDWLCGNQMGGRGQGSENKKRLRTHYVAMTRPSHLLCLAMKRSTFEEKPEKQLLEKMKQHGWNIEEV